MIGKFKDKIFKVSNSEIYTFNSFSNNVKLNFEEQEVEGGKSKIYIKGSTLQELSLSIDLNAELGANVEEEINDWKTYGETGVKDNLYIANKKYGNTWIVTGVSVSDLYNTKDAIISATLSIDFKEFAGEGENKDKKVSNDKSNAANKLN